MKALKSFNVLKYQNVSISNYYAMLLVQPLIHMRLKRVKYVGNSDMTPCRVTKIIISKVYFVVHLAIINMLKNMENIFVLHEWYVLLVLIRKIHNPTIPPCNKSVILLLKEIP